MPGRGRVHENFEAHIRSLREAAAVAGLSAGGGTGRVWSHPPGTPGWTGSVLDVPGLTNVFDRQAINQNYEECLADAANPGTEGDVIALRTQSDYVAARERAYRLRHATPVRCAAHACARRRGLGSPAGVFVNGVLRYVQDTLRQGAGT